MDCGEKEVSVWWCWAFESALMLGVTLCGTEMGE